MDLKKILDLVSKNNIDQQKLFELVGEAKSLDLKDETNIRYLIRKGSKLANKTIDKQTEDKIVETIKTEGIGTNLFKFL